jgi:membrane protein YqaA with SNARE-associated domain
LTAFAAHSVLFLVSLLAATILPGSSEATLLTLIAIQPQHTASFTAIATVGNTIGAVINWFLGRWLMHFSDRSWFPTSTKRLEQATIAFRRYGTWSLLFSWVPIVGDPLTVAAGALRVPFPTFIILTGLGKFARYVLLVAGLKAIQNL